ncbi:TonB-dependent receptor plug domain-containing protein [Luteithermobacter gelatinilyticus]|uniref:TonB-dependent receptor plug domain-containing protein n=1 Tax=Luteithermobacter gelatinilyticus TaxID=2582913 RepID=UPI00143E0BBA|nr:TonB-dependent receptor [Luteithermobacter gelatinilyticus]
MRKHHLTGRTSLLAFLITFHALPGYAESAAESAYVADEEIVVTATRYARPLSEVGSSIETLDSDDLTTTQTVFIQDALQTIPGLTLNSNGAFGGTSSLRIRGASSDQTVVLIDGIQINDVSSPGGGYNFAHLDPTGIDRIEVLKGPQSILYGSDAIGGVINIITATGKPGLGGGFSVEGGSYNTLRSSGSLYGGNDKITFNLSLSGIRTDGISKADENDGNTEQDGYWNYTLHGKVRARLNDTFSTELISRYTDNRNEFDQAGPMDGAEIGYSEEFLIGAKGYLNFADDRFRNTFSVDYAETNRESISEIFAPFVAEGTRFNLDYLGIAELTRAFILSFGAQHETSKAASVSDKSFDIDSLFSELSWQGLEGFTLTAGLRYDDHSQYGATTTPRFTASYYREATGTKVFANWAEGFKAPSVFQLTFVCTFCGLSAPNPDLKPEESEGWEIGIEQAFLQDRLFLAATYFRQDVDNMIDFSFTSGYDNINRVRSQGVELRLVGQITDTLKISGNYTYTDATDRNSGEKLIRVPEHMAYGQMDWQATDRLGINLAATYNGEENDRGGQIISSWLRIDLRARYRLQDHIEIFGRIDNLFDKEYQQVLGYGTPDRSVYAGIRGTF